jgi:hypothetical protein
VWEAGLNGVALPLPPLDLRITNTLQQQVRRCWQVCLLQAYWVQHTPVSSASIMGHPRHAAAARRDVWQLAWEASTTANSTLNAHGQPPFVCALGADAGHHQELCGFCGHDWRRGDHSTGMRGAVRAYAAPHIIAVRHGIGQQSGYVYKAVLQLPTVSMNCRWPVPAAPAAADMPHMPHALLAVPLSLRRRCHWHSPRQPC